ncbi:3735_t:CDS:2 [Rhizophagus irregularis]|nr:3735_t:CDS:2 [Rhizophagus irregularis]
MNGYSSDIFNTKSTYVGSNPHTMQIPYNPRNLPSSGTPVANVTAVYHDCHCDNDDSELTCTMCGDDFD